MDSFYDPNLIPVEDFSHYEMSEFMHIPQDSNDLLLLPSVYEVAVEPYVPWKASLETIVVPIMTSNGVPPTPTSEPIPSFTPPIGTGTLSGSPPPSNIQPPKKRRKGCRSTPYQPKYAKDSMDPNLTAEEVKSIKKSKKCKESRDRKAEELKHLQEENAALRRENSKLKAENRELRHENNELKEARRTDLVEIYRRL